MNGSKFEVYFPSLGMTFCGVFHLFPASSPITCSPKAGNKMLYSTDTMPGTVPASELYGILGNL
jgi:hypothetical protein